MERQVNFLLTLGLQADSLPRRRPIITPTAHLLTHLDLSPMVGVSHKRRVHMNPRLQATPLEREIER